MYKLSKKEGIVSIAIACCMWVGIAFALYFESDLKLTPCIIAIIGFTQQCTGIIKMIQF